MSETLLSYAAFHLQRSPRQCTWGTDSHDVCILYSSMSHRRSRSRADTWRCTVPLENRDQQRICSMAPVRTAVCSLCEFVRVLPAVPSGRGPPCAIRARGVDLAIFERPEHRTFRTRRVPFLVDLVAQLPFPIAEVVPKPVVGIDDTQARILHGQEAGHDVTPRRICEEFSLSAEQEEADERQVRRKHNTENPVRNERGCYYQGDQDRQGACYVRKEPYRTPGAERGDQLLS